MTAELVTYDHYIRGNVYSYLIQDKDGTMIDSCCGFIGDYEDGALREAREHIDAVTNDGKTDHKGQHLMPFIK